MLGNVEFRHVEGWARVHQPLARVWRLLAHRKLGLLCSPGRTQSLHSTKSQECLGSGEVSRPLGPQATL